jgi:hypothetical protein
MAHPQPLQVPKLFRRTRCPETAHVTPEGSYEHRRIRQQRLGLRLRRGLPLRRRSPDVRLGRRRCLLGLHVRPGGGVLDALPRQASPPFGLQLPGWVPLRPRRRPCLAMALQVHPIDRLASPESPQPGGALDARPAHFASTSCEPVPLWGRHTNGEGREARQHHSTCASLPEGLAHCSPQPLARGERSAGVISLRRPPSLNSSSQVNRATSRQAPAQVSTNARRHRQETASLVKVAPGSSLLHLSIPRRKARPFAASTGFQ